MESVEDDYIIPTGFFDIVKPVITVEVPFCNKIEVSSKQFTRKFHNFTGSKFDLRITRKTKTLFKLKNSALHAASKIYHGFPVTEKLI